MSTHLSVSCEQCHEVGSTPFKPSPTEIHNYLSVSLILLKTAAELSSLKISYSIIAVRRDCYLPHMLGPIKIMLSLCLISYALCYEDIWGSGGIAPTCSTSALGGDWWLAARFCRFIPRQRSPGSDWIGGWVNPRTSLDTGNKRKMIRNCSVLIRNSLIESPFYC
jgi:hypothetical protein